MAIGLGWLRLSPHTFWTMTPREFERAISILATPGNEPPDRSGLRALMNAFPDI